MILKKEKFEELLLVNWTKFLDIKQLMSFILIQVKSNINSFTIIEQQSQIAKRMQITLSQFQFKEKGFIIWVEFIMPIDDKIAVGTSEILLNHKGELSHIKSLGNLYSVG